ncbi:uncharacterized protein SCHCODRAFT_02632073 [Schizophyllum commune H4-8]|uniref:Protein-S-isoprenylcysteine O-methyltransferase n=1 Tax=Schizophyllum commune (strain H4-8 / FGSC 9210) TaxID=578458 RepID=D8Q984_SCHCM|nr:uncharacterized protein SCHCODRAFT_02632073 [Schizophyllum commune H4-8]KAI5890514.1 hypothetical protein SCHCODRAFT_02632073 [Schizophyllum commune H4-8]
MSLAKIPFLVSVIWGINHGLISPNRPLACDRPLSRPLVERYYVPCMEIVRKILCAISLIEVALITNSHLPSSPFASCIPDALMPIGGLQSLRITTPFILGCLLNALGTLIRIHCYRKLGSAFTFELAIRREQALVTDGAYSIVRHPGYTGGYMVVAGWFLAQMSSGCWAREYPEKTASLSATALWLGLLFPLLVGTFLRIDAEEMMLKGRFGKEWEEWAKRVPYKLVPRVW